MVHLCQLRERDRGRVADRSRHGARTSRDRVCYRSTCATRVYSDCDRAGSSIKSYMRLVRKCFRKIMSRIGFTLRRTRWSDSVKEQIRLRSDNRCFYCDTPFASIKDRPQLIKAPYSTDEPEMEHHIPLCQGGQDVVDNLVAACRQCNRTKFKSMPCDFVAHSAGNIRPRCFALLPSGKFCSAKAIWPSYSYYCFWHMYRDYGAGTFLFTTAAVTATLIYFV